MKMHWANAFPIIKDLVIDRSLFDRIQQAGGYVSGNTLKKMFDANTIPVIHDNAEESFNNPICTGCGACVAAYISQCSTVHSAQISQLAFLL